MKAFREQASKRLEEKDKQLKTQQESFQKQQKADSAESKALEALTKEIQGLREQAKLVSQAHQKTEAEKKSAVEYSAKLEAQLREAKKAPAPTPVSAQPRPAPSRPSRKSGNVLAGVGPWLLIAVVGLVAIVWALH